MPCLGPLPLGGSLARGAIISIISIIMIISIIIIIMIISITIIIVILKLFWLEMATVGLMSATGISKMTDDSARRCSETESLAAIFGDDFAELPDATGWRFQFREASDASSATLTCFLPKDYPSCSPPVLVFVGPIQLRGRDMDSEEICTRVLAEFVPGEEFGLTLGGQFFRFCNENFGESSSQRGDPNELVNADGDATEAVIALADLDFARKICSALQAYAPASGFQEFGVGIFVHRELGVALEFRGPDGAAVDVRATAADAASSFADRGLRLHVTVDGVDTQDATVWLRGAIAEVGARERRPGRWRRDSAGAVFVSKLLRWVETQRAAEEEKYLAADGVGGGAAGSAGAGSPAATGLTGHSAYKARLQAGETVQFRGGGNSLNPRIKSGECCKYAPVFRHEDVKEKDIVFCQIKGRYWGHMVKKKTFVGGAGKYVYTISNIHGWENGTIGLEHIYGKVVDHWK